jgi:hypothetical protein
MFLNFRSKIEPALNNKSQITLSNDEHHQEPVVKMAFVYNREIIDKIKSNKSIQNITSPFANL